MATITYWKNLLDTKGQEIHADWSEIFRRLSVRRGFFGDQQHPGWSPARFDPVERALANVVQVEAICLDYDEGETVDAAQELWADYYGLIHTTRKHTPEAPRFRVILPLSRPVNPAEFGQLWPRVNARASGKLDPSPKDPSRFWFLPGCPPDAEFVCRELTGAFLDPDEWLALEFDDPDPEPVRTVAPRANDTIDIEDRAIAYLAKMPAAVSGSGGHKATWDAALVLAKGFGLSESATTRLLADHYNPRCEPPWRIKELEHKARDAAAASRVKDGFLLDSDWEPRQPTWRTDVATDPVMREPGDDTNEILAEESNLTVKQKLGFKSMRDLLTMVMEALQSQKPEKGLPTGVQDLDEAIGGYRPGMVTVFGAKRGFGKTSYGNMAAALALEHGAEVALFAGEDSYMVYAKRFMARYADINALALRDLEVRDQDWDRVTSAVSSASQEPFLVRVERNPVEWIAKAIQAIGRERGAKPMLVIVDYLQCLKTSANRQDRRNEVTHIFQALSQAIKSVNAAGILFSQLKRTERTEPEVEDLKESGDIEDGADHILLGWREGTDQEGTVVIRKLKVAKNKDGTDGDLIEHINLRFNRKTANFEFTPSEPRRSPRHDGFDDHFDPSLDYKRAAGADHA